MKGPVICLHNTVAQNQTDMGVEFNAQNWTRSKFIWLIGLWDVYSVLIKILAGELYIWS